MDKIKVGIAGTGKIVPESASAMQQCGYEIAAIRGLWLFETISNIYLRSWALIKDRLPEIGSLKLFQADFSQYSSRYDAYLAGDVSASFNPDCEGGTLRDLNVQHLHTTRQQES